MTVFLFSTGPDKHKLPVTLPRDQAGEVLTVEHLAAHVAAKTGVPASNQRLIFKGDRFAHH